MKRNPILMAAAAGAEASKSTGASQAAQAANVGTSPGATPGAAVGSSTLPAQDGAATHAGGVPATNVAGAESPKPKRAPKNPDNILNIINGRLPLALVYLIRFKEVGVATANVAKKYGTSVGKVFDIVKNHNFQYVDASYKPAADEMAAAIAWCDTNKTSKGQTLKEAGGDPDAIKVLLKGLTVATGEEVAKRNWATRTVGAPAAGTATAPVAGATSAAAAAAPATTQAGQGAKLF